jgi:hypothetical protein
LTLPAGGSNSQQGLGSTLPSQAAMSICLEELLNLGGSNHSGFDAQGSIELPSAYSLAQENPSLELASGEWGSIENWVSRQSEPQCFGMGRPAHSSRGTSTHSHTSTPEFALPQEGEEPRPAPSTYCSDTSDAFVPPTCGLSVFRPPRVCIGQ